jgi:hypothetical protein
VLLLLCCSWNRLLTYTWNQRLLSLFLKWHCWSSAHNKKEGKLKGFCGARVCLSERFKFSSWMSCA